MDGPWNKYQAQTQPDGPWTKYAQADSIPAKRDDFVTFEQHRADLANEQPGLLNRVASAIAGGITHPPLKFIVHQAQIAQQAQEKLGLAGPANADSMYAAHQTIPLPEKLGGSVTIDAPTSKMQGARMMMGEGLQTALLGIPGGTMGRMGPAMHGAVMGGTYGLGSAIESAQSLKQAGVDIGAGVLGGAIIGKGAQLAGDALSNALRTKTVASVVGENFKAIRPTVAGKDSYTQIEKYNQRAADAVASIIENKPNLELLDKHGELTGKLPQNLEQFSQAIDQTKGKLFERFNAMQEAAGKSGATVDLTPIVKELEKISNDKIVSQLHPEVANYAKGLAERFSGDPVYTTQEAQTAIATLNTKLKPFYKNQSYENASTVSVDEMVARRLRVGLDDSILKSTEPGYQALRNKYGALSAIEKDVAHRVGVDARRNAKGLIDYTDIFSASDVIGGLVKREPSMIAAGMAKKAVAAVYKMRNDPNVIVRKMFQQAERVSE